MRQLELKYICGYLPYGLKVMHNEWEEVLTMDCAGSSSNSLSIEDVSEYAKPFLRPLSDLTKEITHNGETFVPIDLLEDLYVMHNLRNRLNQIIKDNNWIMHLDYVFIKELESMMFDIHGLIDSGLAIDINTLDENPY